jgi:hypothetical protein
MPYEHHVFISYARGEMWTPYVKNVFLPRLNAYLENEIGFLQKGVPLAFFDEQIEMGAHWDPLLKHKVACSTVMVCLFSANYFKSVWCRREMALMLEREQHCGLHGNGDNYGLVIPVRLGDGDTFPDLASRVQHRDFEDYADPDIEGTPRASELNKLIQALAKTIAKTIKQANPCCPDWQNFTGDAYFDLLEHKPLTTTPPRLLV